MSNEKEIPFVIFLKSIYEVRPKKHPTSNKTHHWKLRIETLKSTNDIKRVEFILHNTFQEPYQIRKKPPFEIEEEGFGNFEMQINIKILNRKIPLPYFIQLMPNKVTTIQFHHSVWMVKPKELSKVLEIGGIPMEKFDNNDDEMKALTKILEFVKRHSDRPLDPSIFYPKVYERVFLKIKRLEASETSSSFIYNPDNDVAHSDDSSSTRQSHNVKSHNLLKHNKYESLLNEKSKMKPSKTFSEFMPSPKMDSHKSIDFEVKKELKRKKNHYESSSESDSNVCSDNPFGSQKKIKKNDGYSRINKHEEVKLEKTIASKPAERVISNFPKQENIIKTESIVKSSNKQSMPSKPKSTDKSNLKQLKDPHKLKLKIKDNFNPDSFNKIFEAQDILVVNRNKANFLKNKEESNVKRSKQDPNVKHVERKNSTPIKMTKESLIERSKKNVELFGEENVSKKSKSIKQEEKTKNPMKDGRSTNKQNSSASDSNTKSVNSNSKMKLPEKTIPEQKKMRENENSKIQNPKSKKPNSNLYSRNLSRSSSSGSDHGSAFSKSSSDNEIDHDMFKPKKKLDIPNSDQTNVVVKQLFGDDKSDGSDEDDDDDEIDDMFNSIKNPDKKSTNKPNQNKRQNSSLDKSDDDISSDNEPSHGKDIIASRSQSPDLKLEAQKLNNSDTINKSNQDGLEETALSYKERRRLAKQLIKINDKDFFEKLQRLLLTSYRNKERSLRFDPETMKLDFHMGEISDKLAFIIKAMVDEYFEEHHPSQAEDASSHGF